MLHSLLNANERASHQSPAFVLGMEYNCFKTVEHNNKKRAERTPYGLPDIRAVISLGGKQPMRITKLHLYTQDLHAQRLFYTRTLGLPLVTETGASFTIQAGATRLVFQRTEQEGFLYHFAFSIPSTKLAHAKEWLLARTPSVVPLLSLDGQDEFHDDSWIISQFYFHDATGNILEFIAHHDVPDSTPDGFDEHSVLHVSEIGLAVDNVLAQVAEFKDRLGLEPFRGESDDTFTAVGDTYGRFIVVKIGRFWFPTETDAASVAPVRVTVEGAEEQHYHVSPYPYEIDVVAKTSRS
jgi:catechol-2,3-dioxygenase